MNVIQKDFRFTKKNNENLIFSLRKLKYYISQRTFSSTTVSTLGAGRLFHFQKNSPHLGHVFFDAKWHGDQCLLKSFCSPWRKCVKGPLFLLFRRGTRNYHKLCFGAILWNSILPQAQNSINSHLCSGNTESLPYCLIKCCT